MLETLRQNLAAGLQHLSVRLQRAGTIERLPHHECPVLIFFHGYSLAHTIRPLVVGRALRARGYPVEFAGMGPHAARIAAEGFQVYAVDAFFVGQHSAHHIGTAYLMSEPEFVHSLNLSTPTDLDVEAIRTLLHRNLSRGMPHTREGSRIAFDRAASWNWLYDHEPAFFESDYRALEERRRHFFQHANGHIALHRDRQRYRLTYTYRLYPPTLPPDTKAQLFLPYPIPSPHQGDIELRACVPDDLRTCLVPQAGFFYGYPIQVEEAASASVDFSYTCELTVQGRIGPTASASLSACEYRRYSEIDPKLAREAVVKNFFAELDLDGVEDPLEKARRMYAQLVGVKRFKKTKEQSQDLASSIHVVLNDSGGHCITLSNAFIALCRLQGIAARQSTAPWDKSIFRQSASTRPNPCIGKPCPCRSAWDTSATKPPPPAI